jgi:hypothetical protein
VFNIETTLGGFPDTAHMPEYEYTPCVVSILKVG